MRRKRRSLFAVSLFSMLLASPACAHWVAARGVGAPGGQGGQTVGMAGGDMRLLPLGLGFQSEHLGQAVQAAEHGITGEDAIGFGEAEDEPARRYGEFGPGE